MKISFLGTGSGTEPVRGYRHVSFAVEHGGRLFVFDAGESCSYTAHLAGLDLLSTRAVFISHAHMDHIGGLPKLLWDVRKLNIAGGGPSKMAGRRVDVFAPDPRLMPAVFSMLSCTEGGFSIDFEVVSHPVSNGVVFDEGGFSVEASRNGHLGSLDGVWLSYSFRARWESGSFVYSGDMKDVSELDPLLPGASLLLVETGHHKVEDVCLRLKALSGFAGRVCFIHHGLAILNDFEGELRKAKSILGDRVLFAKDGGSLEL